MTPGDADIIQLYTSVLQLPFTGYTLLRINYIERGLSRASQPWNGRQLSLALPFSFFEEQNRVNCRTTDVSFHRFQESASIVEASSWEELIHLYCNNLLFGTWPTKRTHQLHNTMTKKIKMNLHVITYM